MTTTEERKPVPDHRGRCDDSTKLTEWVGDEPTLADFESALIRCGELSEGRAQTSAPPRGARVGYGAVDPAARETEEEGHSREKVGTEDPDSAHRRVCDGGRGRGSPFHRRQWSQVRRWVKAGSFGIRSFSEAESKDRAAGDGGDLSVLGSSGHHWRHDRRRRPWERRWEDSDLPYEFTLAECAAALVMYLLVGVLSFSVVFERWPVVDSLYFSVVTVTTVGYGDLTPATRAGRLFTTFFAVVGIAFLGIALGVLGSRIVEAEVRAVEVANRETAKRVAAILGAGKGSERGQCDESVENSHDGPDDSTRSTSSRHMNRDEVEERREPKVNLIPLVKLLVRYAPALVPLFLGAFFIGRLEGWGLCDAIYYCAITTATIGYGDLTPIRQSNKWFAVFFIPLAVGAMGHMLGAVANSIIEQRREAYQKRLWSHDLTLGDLEAMDWDKDGTVSELEYVEFMLLTLKKVDKELLHELHEQFQELDVTHSGTLTKRDLKLLAKQRLKRVRNKLKLSSYKHELLRVGKVSTSST